MTVDRPADLVLTGGRIATMDAARSWASALAVRDGRIVAVGPDAAVAAAHRAVDAGHRAARSDGHAGLPGRARPPGPRRAGDAALRAPRGSAVRTAVLTGIAAYAPPHPDETWIRGGGWYMAAFPGGTPRREDLDRDRPRPAGLPDQPRRPRRLGQHARRSSWPASTADTPDPADGRIERDPDGTPSGTLHEGAMDLVDRFLPDDTPADLEEALRLGQAHLHALGITAWQDAIVEPRREERAYVALASRGELTGRVVGALWWEHHRGAEQIEEFVERRARDGDRPLRGRRASS